MSTPEHTPGAAARLTVELALSTAPGLAAALQALARSACRQLYAERATLVIGGGAQRQEFSYGMLKRQLLGQIASVASLPVEELATEWQTRAAAPSRPAPPRARPAAPRRQMPRQPEDRVLWALLLECGWWAQLSAEDHEALCALEGWHGEAFRLIDRISVDEGALPWAALRERITGEEWGGRALGLVEGEDPAIEPTIDDLRTSVAQLHKSASLLESMRILGRR